MRKFLSCILAIILLSSCANNNLKVNEWVATTETNAWVNQVSTKFIKSNEQADVTIDLNTTYQSIEGFGGCFNELGWTSLNALSESDRESIFSELFEPGKGANFSICRMPLGANDFSLDWYSYNETENDFDMKNFSIDNDLQTLVPYIKNAKKYNANLKLWASPWSPPSWMKWNKHYACATPWEGLDIKYQNQLPKELQGKEGSNMFIQDDRYFKAYALYFSKFIKAYKQQDIEVSMVMPQNEFNSCQIFPSCTWTSASLAKFIGEYLGPEMEKTGTDIMFGTMERPALELVDTVLNDPNASKYIKGVGFQWAGKESIPGVHQQYPNMKLYQTEQECGDGKNDWKFCTYSWSLLKHFLSNGANSYLYWNMSLPKGGISRWGWSQNSLVTVDTVANTYKYNHEYYLMKHFSRYIKQGATRIKTSGEFDDILAFSNPDGTLVIVAYNKLNESKELAIEINSKILKAVLQPSSFNSILISN